MWGRYFRIAKLSFSRSFLPGLRLPEEVSFSEEVSFLRKTNLAQVLVRERVGLKTLKNNEGLGFGSMLGL